jgi:hypothetical protein
LTRRRIGVPQGPDEITQPGDQPLELLRGQDPALLPLRGTKLGLGSGEMGSRAVTWFSRTKTFRGCSTPLASAYSSG